MKKKLKAVCTKTLVIILTVVSICSVAHSSALCANAASYYSQLGTNAALGSPILNKNFVSNNWNKWELICWGVFLSNFCVPLVDNYKTAFASGQGGTNGAGFKALCFGSGNDAENNDIIKDLCDYALNVQASELGQVYVSYSLVVGDDIYGYVDSNYDGKIDSTDNVTGDRFRKANFRDLVVMETDTAKDYYTDAELTDGLAEELGELKENIINDIKDTTYEEEYNKLKELIKNVKNTYSIYSTIDVEHSYGDVGADAKGINENNLYYQLLSMAGFIPTFWIKDTSGNYTKIFDYTDPWDFQVSTLMVSKAISSKDLTDDFAKNYENALKNKSNIQMDFFANIVLEGNAEIVIPASANQNITSEKKINLVNSFIMNGAAEDCNGQYIVEHGAQYIDTNWMDVYYGSTPALSGEYTKLKPGSTFIYYDLDEELAKQDDEKKKYGELLSRFFDKAELDSNMNNYNLRVEAVDIISSNWWNASGENESTGINAVADNQIASSIFSVYNKQSEKQKTSEILTEITLLNGSKLKLFNDDPVTVPVAVNVKGKDNDNQGVNTRRMWNYFYQNYKGKVKDSTSGIYMTDSLKAKIKNEIYDLNDLGRLLSGELNSGKNLWDIYVANTGNKDKYEFTPTLDLYANECFGSTLGNGNTTARVIILYPSSDVMQAVSDILGLVDGTEFSTYSTYIYMTYLDFYGVNETIKSNGTTDKSSKFNTTIFENLDDVTIEEITENIKSEEDMEQEILNYSYLMLSPTAGRDYRHQLITSGIADFISEQYNRIVYGTASNNSNVLSTTSKSNSGFLHVDKYSENFATAWFIEGYSTIAAWIIMASIILMIPIGLLRKRKAVWYLLTAVTVINTVLVMPSVGEMVPYFTSEMVQTLFTNKMTYWSISEAVTNSRIEADAVTQTGGLEGLTEEEANQVMTLVKSLNVLNTDRALMVKRDISAKVTQKVSDDFTEIQSLKSARWLLPMIMRQYSQGEQKADYVYVQVGDLFDNMSNLYWRYNPEDAGVVSDIKPTMTSGQVDDIEGLVLEAEFKNAHSSYSDFVNLYSFDDLPISEDEGAATISFQSSAYEKGLSNDTKDTDEYGKSLYHTYNYIYSNSPVIKKDNNKDSTSSGDNKQTTESEDTNTTVILLPSRKQYTTAGKNTEDSFTEYANSLLTNSALRGQIKQVAKNIEAAGDQYDFTKIDTTSTMYGYLWATENPINFFYGNIKQSFDATMSTGKLIGQLQGEFGLDKNGNEVRDSFMHATEEIPGSIDGIYPTGYVRDVIDLQNLFTNMVPYLYQMQIAAGGMDGESGLLVQDNTYKEGEPGEYVLTEPIKITDYELYEGEDQNWLFRSNWVVKLMECDEYTKKAKVKDSTGKSYTIECPLLAECYPKERPMIFSEAQMKAYNLTESDLNIVELKCLEVNDQVVDKWTLLINYAGTSGITLEVLERQMAIDALLVFNDVFSPSTVFNSSYEMYPQTLDLRNISFDSVMKMLMINVSRDTSYIYGDTMTSLIETTDLVTSSLLLIDAFLCASVIPFLRNILMALIFYLGFVSILRTLFSSAQYKAKIACGQLISNILFLFITLCYYLVFFALITVTSHDEVLTVDSVQVTAGNPVWVLIIVLAASIIYILFMAWQFNFCWKNYRDMGIEIYSSVMHSVADKIGNGIKGVRADISGKQSSETKSTNTKSTKSTSTRTSYSSEQTDGSVIVTREDDNTGRDNNPNNSDSSAFTNRSNIEEPSSRDNQTTHDINESIRQGERHGRNSGEQSEQREQLKEEAQELAENIING